MKKKWSKWLGVKYSTYVNSGSSANFISISVLKYLNKNKDKNEISSLTWVSDINSVIMNNFKPVFVDVNLNNLSMNIDQVIKKINRKIYSFYNSCPSFNGLNEKLIGILKRKNI